MISIRSTGVRLCDRVSRREVMRIGGIGACGLSLPLLLNVRSSGAQETAAQGTLRPSGGKARSCIVLFLMGGPPQHSTWDPKPEAPNEVRGQIGSIETAIPGVRFGELMPKLAQRADKLAVLRAVGDSRCTTDPQFGQSLGAPGLTFSAFIGACGRPVNM